MAHSPSLMAHDVTSQFRGGRGWAITLGRRRRARWRGGRGDLVEPDAVVFHGADLPPALLPPARGGRAGREGVAGRIDLEVDERRRFSLHLCSKFQRPCVTAFRSAWARLAGRAPTRSLLSALKRGRDPQELGRRGSGGAGGEGRAAGAAGRGGAGGAGSLRRPAGCKVSSQTFYSNFLVDACKVGQRSTGSAAAGQCPRRRTRLGPSGRSGAPQRYTSG